jgi:hypothetical protein
MDIIDLEELGVPLKIDLKLPIFSNFENFIGFEDLFGNEMVKIKTESGQLMDVAKEDLVHFLQD